MDRRSSLLLIVLLVGQVTAQVDVTSPGDVLRGVPNDGDWPGGENPSLAIDDRINTKYLHFKGETQPTGFQVTPSLGLTVVTRLTLTTANDAAERDPVAFALYGSNVSIDGPYTRIADGDVVDFAQGTAWPRFTTNATPITFANTTAYAHYQLLFTRVRNAAGANSMQIAEAELLGSPAGELPPDPDPGNPEDLVVGTSVVISEFKAINETGLSTTVEGEITYPDWIELRNRGTVSVNLLGWYLTDDPGDLRTWALPATTLAPGGYLLVFASGIQEQDHPENWPYRDQRGYYHTNFVLAGEGEYLALVSPDLQVVQEYGSHVSSGGFPPQRADLSYGLYGQEQQYFAVATPGRANYPGHVETSNAAVFSREAGTFNGSFLLELSSPNPAGQIHYTLDGQIPTTASSKYAGPIPITGTKEVVARVYEPGKAPSAVVSRTYVALANDVLGFNSDLPIVLVDTARQSIGGTLARVESVIIDTGADGRARITDPPDFYGRAGIKIRGSSTAGAAKPSYALEVWDENNRDRDVSILGLPAESDWILYGPYSFDRAQINNALMFGLSNQIGRYAVRTRFVEMYLNRNDDTVSAADYVGLYIFMEKIKRGDKRVDVEKLEPWDSTEPRIAGGYMLKIDRADPGDSGFRTARGNPTYGDGTLCYVDPKESEITARQAAWIKGYLNDFETALYGASFADPQAGYAKYIDVDSFIDHNLLNLLAMNVDALRLSTHLHKTRAGKLEMGPLWDFDRALDSTDGRDDNAQSWHGTGDGTDYHKYIWWNRLFEDTNFWQRYIDRWYVLRAGPFSTAGLNATIDAMAAEIREAQVRNFAKWTSVRPRFGGFQGEIDHLKQWLQTRCRWIDSQFVAPPAILPAGGRVQTGTQVTLVNPHAGGILYYTLDGSDPRLPRSVHVYAGPIAIAESTQIKARVLVAGNSYSPWSGLAEAIFDVGPAAESLRINEIMYNPAGAEDAEYVELLHTGDSAITLYDAVRGIPWRFTDNPEDPALDVLFPAKPPVTLAPGECLLLVKDWAALQAAYSIPAGVQVLEWGDGKLANSGETLVLSAPGDENMDGTRSWILADSAAYSDGSHPEDFTTGIDPWPAEADGRGSSLHRIAPETDGNDPAAWRAAPPSPGVAKQL
jgi:hypothetical protein